jgi:hypothetical protein
MNPSASVASTARTVTCWYEENMHTSSTKPTAAHEYMSRMVANIAQSVRVLSLLRLHLPST